MLAGSMNTIKICSSLFVLAFTGCVSGNGLSMRSSAANSKTAVLEVLPAPFLLATNSVPLAESDEGDVHAHHQGKSTTSGGDK